jgi:hypothetical protein
MLWYKAWLETRFGLAFLFGLYTLVWLVASTGARMAPEKQAPKPQEIAFMADAFAFPFIAAAISLAGTGIKTPSGGFQTKLRGFTAPLSIRFHCRSAARDWLVSDQPLVCLTQLS